MCFFVKDKDIFLYKAPPEETLLTKEQNNAIILLLSVPYITNLYCIC